MTELGLECLGVYLFENEIPSLEELILVAEDLLSDPEINEEETARINKWLTKLKA